MSYNVPVFSTPEDLIPGRNGIAGAPVRLRGNGIPEGPGVHWAECDRCGGAGVEYPDENRCRECPTCQGVGHIPYFADSVTHRRGVRRS